MSLRLEYKATGASAPVAESGLVEADETTGVVVAIVSITGVVDEDNDLVQPGAYTKTLKARTPKGIFHHDWHKWVARTLEIKELPPGDPLLPKTTRSGDPWPAEAGGLWVKCQFNLDTQQGREAFSNVKFFEDEAEWSIGYKVQPGNSRKRPDGVRVIKALDLYEYSPVLFGAAPLSGTLSVKSARPERPEEDYFLDSEDDSEDDSEEEPGEDILQPAADMAEDEPPDGGDPLDSLSLLDLTSDAGATGETADPSEPPEGLSLFDEPEVKGSRASLNRSPRKNWVEKAGELPGYIREVARSIHEKRGIPLDQAIPTAIAAVKRWAAGGDDVDADTRAKAAAAVAEWEALKAKNGASHAAKALGRPGGYDPELETGPEAGHVAAELSTKSLQLPGTIEELTGKLRTAVEELFIPNRQLGDDAVKPAAAEDYHWVSIEGTWSDRIVVTHEHGPHGSVRDSYSIPYLLTPDGEPILGAPQPVAIAIVPTVTPLPALAEKADELVRLASSLPRLQEKAGKVFSAANEKRLRQALELIMSAFRDAGIEISGPDRPDVSENIPSTPSTMVDTDTTAPSVRERKVLLDGGLLERMRAINAFEPTAAD